MTGTFYDNLAKTGNTLLAKYGKDVVITRVVNGSYDVATGDQASTTTTTTIKGQIFEYSDRRIGASGGLILDGDRKLLVSAVGLSFTPNPNTDSVTIGSEKWKIVRVSKPVDEEVVYELQVRRV